MRPNTVRTQNPFFAKACSAGGKLALRSDFASGNVMEQLVDIPEASLEATPLLVLALCSGATGVD